VRITSRRGRNDATNVIRMLIRTRTVTRLPCLASVVSYHCVLARIFFLLYHMQVYDNIVYKKGDIQKDVRTLLKLNKHE
jgi:hypothetical protein